MGTPAQMGKPPQVATPPQAAESLRVMQPAEPNPSDGRALQRLLDELGRLPGIGPKSGSLSLTQRPRAVSRLPSHGSSRRFTSVRSVFRMRCARPVISVQIPLATGVASASCRSRAMSRRLSAAKAIMAYTMCLAASSRPWTRWGQTSCTCVS